MPSRKAKIISAKSHAVFKETTVIFFLAIVLAVAGISLFLFRSSSQAVKGDSTINIHSAQKTRLSCGECLAAGKKGLCLSLKEKVAGCVDSVATPSANSEYACVRCGDITPTISVTPSPKPECKYVKPNSCPQIQIACVEGHACPTRKPCPPVVVCLTVTPTSATH